MKNRGYRELEKERDEYKELAEERGRLIDFKRKDKKNIIKFTNYLVRQKTIEPLLQFLKRDKRPYIFLDPRTAKIIGYNEAFEKELEINGNLQGESYLTILDGNQNTERLRWIRKFLNLDEEKPFDIDYEKDGKTILLHIVKEPPIHMKLDLRPLGGKKDAEIIACVPLRVEKLGKWEKKFHEFRRGPTLEEELALAEGMEKGTKKIYKTLVCQLGWSSSKIEEKEKELGPTRSYLYFKNLISTEKKKIARIRLKRNKKNPRRPKNIVKRAIKEGVEEKKLMALINDSNINYQGLRNETAKLIKKVHEKRLQRKKTTKGISKKLKKYIIT